MTKEELQKKAEEANVEAFKFGLKGLCWLIVTFFAVNKAWDNWAKTNEASGASDAIFDVLEKLDK